MIREVLEAWRPFPINPGSEGSKRAGEKVEKWREEKERAELAKHFGLTDADIKYFEDLDRQVREFEAAHPREFVPVTSQTRLVPIDQPRT